MERAVHFGEMFAGILGHDLRNPLSAITTAAGLLEARADSERIARPARRVVASANRMERMISQLLDFTRIRLGGGLPVERTRVDLTEIARSIIDELEPVHEKPIWLRAEGDPDTSLLYVNANEMPWLMRLIPNTDTALYGSKCASCHRSDRTGGAAAPSLVDIGSRMTREQIAALIRQGTGRMPGFPDMGAKNIGDVVDFLVTGKDQASDPAIASDPNRLKYRNDGEVLWRDPEGYPPITPPWGTLSAIDLGAGTMRWQKPLGEYPELVAKGIKDTGSDNYGGPIVTAGGLLFIAATNFDRKFRAFDKLTGELLWETTLPFAGNATPSTYTVRGKQYIVIAAAEAKTARRPAAAWSPSRCAEPAAPGAIRRRSDDATGDVYVSAEFGLTRLAAQPAVNACRWRRPRGGPTSVARLDLQPLARRTDTPPIGRVRSACRPPGPPVLRP